MTKSTSSPDTDGTIIRLLNLSKVNPNNCKKITRMHPQSRQIHVQVYVPVYQFPCQPSTPGSTRPLGSLWSRSHLHPHTPRPHKTSFPFHIYRLDMALGSISDCWSRLCRPLCRNLCEIKTATDISTQG